MATMVMLARMGSRSLPIISDVTRRAALVAREDDSAFREVCQNHAKAIARLQEKLKSICEKNGWPVE